MSNDDDTSGRRCSYEGDFSYIVVEANGTVHEMTRESDIVVRNGAADDIPENERMQLAAEYEERLRSRLRAQHGLPPSTD